MAEGLRVDLVERCTCKDKSCQSIKTVYRPQGGSYGPGHRNVVLRPEAGMLILDVVDEQIMYVEILDRPRMRRRWSGLCLGAKAWRTS